MIFTNFVSEHEAMLLYDLYESVLQLNRLSGIYYSLAKTYGLLILAARQKSLGIPWGRLQY